VKPSRSPVWALPALLVCLGVYLATQFGDAIRVPFINDDYIFLDLTRHAAFRSLFEPHVGWVGGWYRPWSRELHYWALQGMFGTGVEPWHIVSFGLWLGVMGLYFTLVRRLAGGRRAGVAVAGAAALTAWSVPLVWVAGVQELWMLAWALATLHLWVRGRSGWAAVTFALALLSKETAALLPGIVLVEAVMMERARVRETLRRMVPLVAVLVVWAALHPQLGGRVWRSRSHVVARVAMSADSMAEDRAPAAVPEPSFAPAREGAALLRTPLSLVNLDQVPRPEFGWRPLWPRALSAVLLLGGLVAGIGIARRRASRAVADAGEDALRRRLIMLGSGWALLGWMPLFMPALGWHNYYGLLGALGAWLALATWLESRPIRAVIVIVSLCILRAAQAATPSHDWGTEWYQRRAAEFLSSMRADLLHQHPALPPGTRLFFTRVPSAVGFLTGDAPALRVWYRDPTLHGGFFRDYHARPATTPGEDLFFRYDSTAGWIELTPGRKDTVARSRPDWQSDHERLALTLSRGENWPDTAEEYARLARAFPDSANYAYYAGLARVALGDRAGAVAWLVRAARLPGADDTMRSAARAFTDDAATARSPQR
jgi:hypothetical protein